MKFIQAYLKRCLVSRFEINSAVYKRCLNRGIKMTSKYRLPLFCNAVSFCEERKMKKININILLLILFSAVMLLSTRAVFAQPTANNGSLTTNEETVVLGGTLTTQVGTYTGTLTYEVVASPSNGNITNFDAAAGTYDYEPDPDFNGSDPFTFQVTDSDDPTHPSNPATISITVNGVADIADDTITTNEDTAGSVNALTNDSFEDGSRTITGTTNGTHGNVSTDGTNVTYTPNDDYNGSDTFTYTVTSGGVAETANVTVTVNGVADIANDTITTNEDTAGSVNALTNDSFGGSATITGTTNGTHGTVSTDGTNVTYTPSADFNGADTFTYTVTSGGVTETANVTVTVNAINDVPVFTKGGDQTVDEDAGAQTVAGWATAISKGPADESGQTLTFNVTNNTNTALFSAQPSINATTGTLTFTPADNANGFATVTISLSDNGGGDNTSTPQTFTINVTAVNDTPSFTKGGDQTVAEDSGARSVAGWATLISKGPANESAQTLTFNVSNDNSTLFSAQPNVDATGRLTFTPANNANGSATVTISLSDDGGGAGTSASETFTINVTPVNDNPYISNISNKSTNEDTALTVNFTADEGGWGWTDENAQELTVTATSNNESVIANSGITVNYTPDGAADAEGGSLYITPVSQANGTAAITVTVSDGTASATDTFVVTVNAVNDPPTLDALSDIPMNEDGGAKTVNLTGIDEGGGSIEDVQVVTINATSSDPSIIPNPTITYVQDSTTGTLEFTPVADANTAASGPVTITVEAQDNGGGTAVQTFTVTITPINDMPVFTKGPDQVITEDAPAQVINWATGISAGASNESGQVLTFTVTNNNDSLFSVPPAISSTGQLTYTPALNKHGIATVTVNLKDDNTAGGAALTTADQTFTITISAQNDTPVFIVGPDQEVEEDAGAQTVFPWATGIDDGDPEITQTLNFNVTTDNDSLFSVLPAIDSTNGRLTYTPAANVAGEAYVTVTLTDDDTAQEGTGSAITSPAQTFTITINAINDTPVFTKGEDKTIHEDQGEQSIAGWATGIDDGDPEVDQVLTFNITNTNPGIFISQPSISSDGTLSFSPNPDAVTDTVSATITVTLSDNGDGANTSAAQTFTITIRAVYELTISFYSESSRNEYANVTASAGSIAELSPGGKAPGTFKYVDGDTVTIKAEGTEVAGAQRIGTKFVQWVVPVGDYSPVIASGSSTNTFTLNSDLMLEVEFIGQYIVTSIYRENGKILPGASGEGLNQIVSHGDSLSFTITPNAGYHIADIIVDGSSEGPPPSPTSAYTRTLNNIIEDHEIIAIFGEGTAPFNPPSSAGDDQVYTTTVPPSVMLVMARDHRLYYKAYDDYSDLDDDGQLDIKYTHSIDYYGYFDPYKVYKYNSTPTLEKNRYFYPVRFSADKKTSGNPADGEWSGNFLNWAAMARVDTMRKVLYGGYRSYDENDGTILERTFLPQDAHSWVKVYTPSTATESTDVGTKYLVPWDKTSISLCNTTKDASTNPPLIRVADGEFKQWTSNERWQCACVGEHSDDYDTIIPNKTGQWLGDHTAKVKVAVNTTDVNGKSLIGTEKVKVYPNGNIKPIGLLQTYGETGKINFGLITGSYDKNKSGGLLRKNIGPITGVSSSTDEIDANTGKFLTGTSNKGIISTLNSIRILNYDYSGVSNNGTYNSSDTCPWQLGPDFIEGRCSNWGNPISEMYYEALRYFSGQTATAEFSAATKTNDNKLALTSPAWVDPYNVNNFCSRPFIMVISDISPSFDSDQLPVSPFSGSFTGTLGTLNVEEETKAIGATLIGNEGITGNYFVGQIGTATSDNQCTPKNATAAIGLGQTRGICPTDADRKGSYYLSGMSYWAKRNDLRTTLADEGYKQTVETFSIALSTQLPEIKLNVGNSIVKVMPSAYNSTRKNNSTLVHFGIESMDATSGKFYINWEDSEQGGDYDQDADGFLSYVIDNSVTPAKITFRVEVNSSSTGDLLKIGYVISGTTNNGVFFLADNHGNVDDRIKGDTCVSHPTNSNMSTSDNQVGYWRADDGDNSYNEASWWCGEKTHTVGTDTAASNLKDPLWYAAKWGAFKDVNDSGTPDLQSEWDENGDGDPDTYYRVTNPLRLEHQLNESFKDIMSRGVSHVAPVVSVDEANRTQSGDDLYMAFFKPEDDNYWKGNLKKYGLDRLTRTECGRTKPEWTVTDSQTVSDEQGTHRKIAADCEGSFYASSISYWTNPATGGDGGFVDRGGTGALLLNTLRNIGSSTIPNDYHLNRTILTYKGASDGSLVKFNRTNISTTDLNADSTTQWSRLFNFMYGYTYDANTTTTLGIGTPKAKRTWIMGDIIHSEPRVIDYFDEEDGTLEDRFVAVGSNDGMLHFFNDDGGGEVAAFVPADLLTKIKDLANPGSHRYMVDGSPVLYNSSEIDPVSGYKYKTLIFGERKGGRSYWLLDITSPDPTNWKVKRHIQGGVSEGITTTKTTRIAELGYTWSKPVFTRLRTSATVIKDVVIFTGGYDPMEDSFPEEFQDTDEDGKYDSGESHAAVPGGSEGFDAYNPGKNSMGRGIFVMDVDTGEILFKATYGNIDLKTGYEQTYTDMKYCFPADPSVISFSENQKVIYSADIYGQIWKIVFNYNVASMWTVQRVFTSNPGYTLASGNTDITSAVENPDDSGRKTFYSPDVSYYGNEYTDHPVLYFGTGDREHPKLTMISDRFYSVVDSGTPSNEGNLLNLTCDELDADADIASPEGHDDNDKAIQDSLKNLLTNGSAKGYYRILDKQGDCFTGIGSHVGEKVLSKPTLFAENIYFTTYQPILGEPCNPLGNAYIYGLEYSFGTSAFNYDTTNDGLDGQLRTIKDTFRKIENSAIPSGVRVIMREGEAAGFVSAGGNIVGAGEEGSTSIPGPPGGVARLMWKNE